MGSMEVPGHFDKGNFRRDEDLIGGGLRMNRRRETSFAAKRSKTMVREKVVF